MGCRPRFFIIRKGVPDKIVPLIAVDELPEQINIIGAPRELKPKETKGLYNLGEFFNKSKEPYAVEIMDEYPQNNAPNQTGGNTNIVTEKKIEDAVGTHRQGQETVNPGPSSFAQSDTHPSLTANKSPVTTAYPTQHEGQTKMALSDESQPGNLPASDQQQTNNSGQNCHSIDALPAVTTMSDSSSSSNADDITQPHNIVSPSTLAPLSPVFTEHMASPSLSSSSPSNSTPTTSSPPKPTTPRPALTGLAASQHATNKASTSTSTSTSTSPIHHLPSSPPPLKSPTPSPSSIYCRHYVHHGTCKFGRACRFKHTVPIQASTLSALGLSEIPRWYTSMVAASCAGEGLGLGLGLGLGSIGGSIKDRREVARLLLGEMLGVGANSVKKKGGRRKWTGTGTGTGTWKKSVVDDDDDAAAVRTQMQEEDEERGEEEEEEEMQVAMGRVEADLPIAERAGVKMGIGLSGKVPKLIDI
ncbi:hypothetical protein QBC42DRAFT_325156 [Cladorrhinum samala]|uniref:C3H1-type domain-containing protein n=1 Tax=Cladorrhinum samala TaxID=585594 RepID=A0AAV9HQC4_9PEZI|nr:hypothetical protein QBC42DRAFT_325156 [Cladorrhinum samala]